MVSHPFQLGESDEYGVNLDIFQGPLDLLLYLIRKEEVDIYDIPVAEITRQYLAYVDLIQQLDLEQAGDFVVMAATLMQVKSRMLLPAEQTDEEVVEDPRDELVRRLLEYQQFKDVAGWLEDRRATTRNVFFRGAAFYADEEMVDSAEGIESLRDVEMFDLLAAFKQALDFAPKMDFHEIDRVVVTTEERAAYVVDVLSRRRQVPFFDLVMNVPRIVVVVTFVAILELIKQGRATVEQSDPEAGFWIYHAEPSSQHAADEPTVGSYDV